MARNTGMQSAVNQACHALSSLGALADGCAWFSVLTALVWLVLASGFGPSVTMTAV